MPNLQAEITALQNAQFGVRMDYAVAALLLYEWAVTFSTEVQHIWRPKKTLVFYLFVGLRYSALLQQIFAVFSDALPLTTNAGCASILDLFAIFGVGRTAFMCGLFTLRVYAVWNRNIWVVLSLVALSLGRTCTGAWLEFSLTPTVVTGVMRHFGACSQTMPAAFGSVSAANAATALAFDTAVLALTLIKTVQQVAACRRLKIAQGLTYYVLRDGLLYFIFIELWIVAIIAVSYLPVPAWTTAVVNRLSSFLSTILTQRLFLNLRQVDEELCLSSRSSTSTGELSFAHGSFIGNIGAPLRDPADDPVIFGAEKARQEKDRGRDSQHDDSSVELDEMVFDEMQRDV